MIPFITADDVLRNHLQGVTDNLFRAMTVTVNVPLYSI